jgi:hypothetical protein
VDKLSLVGKVISVVADVLTILGIGGLASWSVLSKSSGSLQERVAAILAYSVKTGACLVILIASLLIAKLPFDLLVNIINGHKNIDSPYWSSAEPLGYIVAYLITISFFGVGFLLICRSVYSWSFGPFRSFKNAFKQDQSPRQTGE